MDATVQLISTTRTRRGGYYPANFIKSQTIAKHTSFQSWMLICCASFSANVLLFFCLLLVDPVLTNFLELCWLPSSLCGSFCRGFFSDNLCFEALGSRGKEIEKRKGRGAKLTLPFTSKGGNMLERPRLVYSLVFCASKEVTLEAFCSRPIPKS